MNGFRKQRRISDPEWDSLRLEFEREKEDSIDVVDGMKCQHDVTSIDVTTTNTSTSCPTSPSSLTEPQPGTDTKLNCIFKLNEAHHFNNDHDLRSERGRLEQMRADLEREENNCIGRDRHLHKRKLKWT